MPAPPSKKIVETPLAKAAAAGHRVVLVVATDGDLGLTSSDYRGDSLGERRLAELRASATAIGAARVEWLGYADSGMVGEVPPDPPDRLRLLRADPDQVAHRIAGILAQERADVVIGSRWIRGGSVVNPNG